MSSLVHELQADAYNSEIEISALLRKAYLISKKLHIKELEVCLHSELNGYQDIKDIPDYREVSGELKAWNPYNGWIPVLLNDTQLINVLSNRKLPDPITNLEALLKGDDPFFLVPFNNDIRMMIAKMANFNTKYALQLSRNQVETIISKVRNMILEWAITLEGDGILGENMSFTSVEKNVAEKKNYTVNNFYGPMNNTQIQQNSDNATQNMQVTNSINKELIRTLIELFSNNIEKLDLDSSKQDEILTSIKTVSTQLESENPNPPIIYECFKTIRNVLEGVASSLIASGLIHQMTPVMQHLSNLIK